jgi:hypothetical protein
VVLKPELVRLPLLDPEMLDHYGPNLHRKASAGNPIRRYSRDVEEAWTGDVFLLSDRQMARISPYFPLVHDVPRVDDCRVVSGIVYVICNGLQWKDAPKEYGLHKML